MSEWRSFLMILKSPRSDVLVLWFTFLITVTIDLTTAIQVGVILSVLLFMRRMAMLSNVRVITDDFDENALDKDEQRDGIKKQDIPPGVEIYEINGPFFFGASYKFMEAMNSEGRTPKVRIIRMRHVLSLDATGLNTLRQQHSNSLKHGIPFIISGIHTQPFIVFEQSGLLKEIGEDNVFKDIKDALARARQILDTH
jgi:SulP family sulfate permease